MTELSWTELILLDKVGESIVEMKTVAAFNFKESIC